MTRKPYDKNRIMKLLRENPFDQLSPPFPQERVMVNMSTVENIMSLVRSDPGLAPWASQIADILGRAMT